MKKLMSLFLAVYMSVMCCCAFVACGNVDVPSGDGKTDGKAVVYYAYDAETDEYDDENYITLKGSEAAWHGIDVSLGEVDFTGSVHYSGDEFTITVNGEFSSMDKCTMTYRGKKENASVLKVNSTVITKYSELVDPAVTTDTTVRYFCKKGSKPKNPVLPTVPEVETDGTYYEYDPQTEQYDETGYYVIDGSDCSIVMDYNSATITLTGTFTKAKGSFVMDCSVKIGVLEMRVVNKGKVEKRGVLHITRTEMYSNLSGEIKDDISSYFCIKGVTPDNPVISEPVIPTVTLNANGGSFAAGSTSTLDVYNGHITLPGYKPTRKGYVFNGYNTEKDGSGDTVDNNTVFSKSATVYAVWAKEVTVTFLDGILKFATKKVGDGMPLGDYDLPDSEEELFKGWFDDNGKQYVSYTIVDGDTTLAATWYTSAEWEDYEKEVESYSSFNFHIYIHYRRKDHLVDECGVSGSVFPEYKDRTNSKTYGDWRLWAWPQNAPEGRFFSAAWIDMWGAVYEIYEDYEFTDCGWDGLNSEPKNLINKFYITDPIGIQFVDYRSVGSKGFWANDGGNIILNFAQGQQCRHVFFMEGNTRYHSYA